ncbi:response regulator transcription factor [Acinetobacter sp. MD2(2019)]|uniref:response regulator transcription factor n=1 Tax=Acinetobacter sp. MD2(2019) TaxID=2605273 RepID=UPI002D1F2D5D|nr:response regulator transcription factor [Acinetobacter sp. MD2(2019)]MEB3754161.1 response regulator transcription factor [Acinetobacter sp. MD2(2019)]
MNKETALIIEDDQDAASILEAYLRRENFDVLIAYDGKKGLDMALRMKPSIVLLDVMLPLMNGTEVLSMLRRKTDIPVIMLTAMGDASDKIGALRYGADDYVVKPYHPGEVMARVQAVLRRLKPVRDSAEILKYQNLSVDGVAMTAIIENEMTRHLLDLTPTEFQLLTSLVRSPLKVFTRFELLEVCSPESNALERVVDTHIYNLRKKLESAGLLGVVINVRGIGYRFASP